MHKTISPVQTIEELILADHPVLRALQIPLLSFAASDSSAG